MDDAGVKRSVRDYYDDFGWQKTPTGRYRDQSADDRDLLAPYWSGAWARVKRLLSAGTLLLDAGCGPVLRPEQRDLYAGYDVPVCVDFSEVALREARAKLGTAAQFVQADVTMLPFRNGSFDGIVSSHVIYHIPEDQQALAIFELHRVLAAPGTGVILYAFSRSVLASLSGPLAVVSASVRALARHGRRATQRRLGGAPESGARTRSPSKPTPEAAMDTGAQPGTAERPASPGVYFFAHDRRWLNATLPPAWNSEVRSWASLDTEVTWRLFRNTAGSRRTLALISWMEDHLPRLMGRIGSYPMIVVRKPVSTVRRRAANAASSVRRA